MKRVVPAGLLLSAAPLSAAAHAFGMLYTLPVPVWMYLYGASAALALSFLMVGYFVTVPAQSAPAITDARWKIVWTPRLLQALRALSVALLGLSIVTGLVGSPNSYSNFNMTFFWIVVLLGYTYATALIGDTYPLISPFRGIVDGIERLRPGAFAGRRPYPRLVGPFPALVLYMGLIAMELFADVRPLSLAVMLIVYTLNMIAGAWWFGRADWFGHGDPLGVFFGVVGRIAPLAWSDAGVRPRSLFAGLLEQPCANAGIVLFILFMLSSTAFDGLHETDVWMRIMRGAVDLVAEEGAGGQAALALVHYGLPALVLLSSPLLYLGLYLGALAAARGLTAARIPMRQLCLEFGGSLVPIAFVYHFTHYFTLAISHGSWILRLASDPFGYGWNLFGTRGSFNSLILIDAGTVWHIQVAAIVAGHIASVWLAHRIALRLFPSRRTAVLSQVPMLVLMMLYTTSGLWILALPIGA